MAETDTLEDVEESINGAQEAEFKTVVVVEAVVHHGVEEVQANRRPHEWPRLPLQLPLHFDNDLNLDL